MKPYLIHAESDAKLVVPSSPKVGALRHGPQARHTIAVFFKVIDTARLGREIAPVLEQISYNFVECMLYEVITKA